MINRLLAEDHGLRLMVMVNDFGAINIDEALIAAQSDDMIALSNGCVCCTMGADLFMALGDALDRDPRPDHLLIEASGVADPAAIANAAIAEPDLSYAGVITLVDAGNAPSLLDDQQIGPQVAQQITAADLVLVTKAKKIAPALSDKLIDLGAKPPALVPDGKVSDLLFDIIPLPRGQTTKAHPHYVSWSHVSDAVYSRRSMGEKLVNRPEGLYRLKDHVLTDDGPYEVHIVGKFVEARRTKVAERTVLVGLGPAGRVTTEEIEARWTADA